jgi:hypothetical protein
MIFIPFRIRRVINKHMNKNLAMWKLLYNVEAGFMYVIDDANAEK